MAVAAKLFQQLVPLSVQAQRVEVVAGSDAMAVVRSMVVVRK